jgi:glycosyltransferase involved in cell wall biosynthesis
MLKVALLAAARSANTRAWVAGLLEQGHDVQVFTFHPGPIDGVRVHGVGPTGSWLPKSRYLLLAPLVRRALRATNPDLVVAYYLTSYGVVSALAWDGPLVLAAAGSDIFRLTPFAGLAYRYLQRRGDLFVAWSPHMARRLTELGVEERRIVTIHRGIDDNVFRMDGRRVESTRPFTLVSTRNFRPIYGLDTLVKATGLVAEQGFDVSYQLLGRGPLLQSLRDLARNLDLEERVLFPGYFCPAMVAWYLRGADVYVSASKSDGASSSLFEAMACGAFPVVSDIPGNRDWIESGVNGYLVPVGDVEAFASAIGRALASPELRQEAANLNLNIVKQKLSRPRNQRLLTDSFRQLVCAKPSHACK